MGAPHVKRYHRYLTKHIAAASLALSGMCALPCAAQVEAGKPAGARDSTAAVRGDSTAPDSGARVSTDSGGPTAGKADSAGQRAGKPDSAAGVAHAQPAPPPVDSVLAAECKDARSSDLLIVAFRPTSTPADRAAVARQVGGTLLGRTVYTTPPGWFLRVPGSSADRSVADRLIALAPVLGVSTAPCPS